MLNKRLLKVFLSYASQDKSSAQEISNRLSNEGWIDMWLGEKKILPGQDWHLAITKAVENSDIVIICLSINSVSKEGYVQKELRYVREIALEKPEGTIFLIPLRLDECEIPKTLQIYQWVDYFKPDKNKGYSLLVESLKIRYEEKLKQEEKLTKITDADIAAKKQDNQVTDSDLVSLSDFLVRSGKAQLSRRRALCIQIGIDPTLLPILNLPTEHDFAVELVYYLYNTKNYNSLLRMCYNIEPLLGKILLSKLRQIYSKLQGI